MIAGQGTVALEMLRQHPGPLDAIFVPVGGGGLLAGIAAYVKYLRPEVKVIGVESEGSACFAAARKAGRRVRLPLNPWIFSRMAWPWLRWGPIPGSSRGAASTT